ncbi:MAG: tRNA (cytidine56-2-O)-methyltransferase [Thermoplasmata archaeon]|jgi:tRNA (cytidine56-2'-O)-methyltransferase|nr:tRNA (cytidine56-2-O)-methyltransferase [Thermoplasmata archaeon]
MRVEVLRLGHRPARDKRITTHVALTARALGAARVRIAEEDMGVVQTVNAVAARFGGGFTCESGGGWKGAVAAWQKAGGQVVHLTMYGTPLSEAAPRVLADGRDVLVVVGAEKVPGDLYQMADANVAVGSQPHSEVAALALLLDRLRGGAWEHDAFPGAKLRVVPTAHGKRVVAADGAAMAAPDDSEE